MGLKAHDTQKLTYVQAENGKLYRSSDKERKEPYNELVGMISNIYYKEETFNGKTVEKTYFVVSSPEGDEEFAINFAVGSKQWAEFISFLKSVDLTSEVTISAGIEKDKDGTPKLSAKGNTLSKFFVSNTGSKAKAFYKKDGDNQLPPWKKVKVGKNEIDDKSEWEDALRADVDEMSKKVGSNTPTYKPNSPAANMSVVEPETFTPSDDDLPF